MLPETRMGGHSFHKLLGQDYKNIVDFKDLVCFNLETNSFDGLCSPTAEGDMHEYGVTCITFIAGFMAMYLINQLAQRTSVVSIMSAEAKALRVFGFLEAFFALFLIFNNNWVYGLGWFFAGISAIGAGTSQSPFAAKFAGFLNIIAFYQNVGTFNLIRLGAPMLDTLVSAQCLEYYARASTLAHPQKLRCDHSEYLQALRVIIMALSLVSAITIILSFAVSGRKQL